MKGKSYKDLRREEAIRAQKQHRIKLAVVWTTVVLVLAFFVFLWTRQGTGTSSSTAGAISQDVFHYDKQPMLGNPQSSVAVVEFGDFKCPTCKYFSQNIFPLIKKDFIDTGKIRFYFINDQFIGQDSITAGIAGEAVFNQNKDAFWKFYDAVYKNQGNEKVEWATPQYLVDLARKENLGIDYNRLLDDLNKQTYLNEVQNDNGIAHQAGVQATPGVYVNGVAIDQVTDYNVIKAAIQKAEGGK